MSEMYTKHAKQYDAVIRNNIYNALLERPSTIALLDDLTDATVIDMGCGSGVYAEWLLGQSVKHLTCVDASKDMINLVQSKLGDRVNAYVQNLAVGLPNETENSADVIVCPLVLHYIENLSPVFAEVYRVLKPGGYMVFSTHHPFVDFESSASGNYFACEYIEEEWNTVGKPVKVSFYRRSLMEISEAISTSGLKIARITEGSVDEKVKSMCETTYQRLKTNPNFIFFRCEKPL
ncbi:class I SAM-dependent DNA methyltransferase [Vibrio neptunius]|uniref:class I SAM-dependent DNA methyltransferase n=1 Tax=Vibrio neptunius TaxID=170651 RepID=UPI0019D2F300|nr:class I SAM-dependent methyltransferase [Vibrio neptunius]MBN3573083.1 class I SAM-dependent methyltransferase [Vibrio neptunius]